MTNDNQSSDSTESGSSIQSTIDASSPLYIHPSDNPSLVLVSTLFNGLGYRSWRRSVLRALSAKNKLGFINGKVKKPDDDSPTYQYWERCDDMITSWILNSLDKEIADSVEFAENAVELWKELEDRYDQPNGTKLYQIQKEINDLTQGSLDITGYFTKMKKLWEELNNLSSHAQCTCQCTCGAKATNQKHEQDRRLIQFLMGLNEMYTTVRGSILMMNPLPTLAQAFSILVQDEKQREVKPNNFMSMDSVSLSANGGGSNGYRTNFSQGGRGTYDRSQNFRLASQNNYSQGYMSKLICEYCKKPGHAKADCFKMKRKIAKAQNPGYNNSNPRTGSYDNNNRYNQQDKGKRPMGEAHNVSVDQGNGENDNVSLSKEQYGHLVSLLHHFQGMHSGDGQSTSSGTGEAAVNFASMIGNPSSFAGPFNEEASGNW